MKKNIDIKINKLDGNKKKTFKNRSLISIFVFSYYILIILFSFFSDSTDISNLINIYINLSKSTAETIKVVLSFVYLLLIYIPLIYALFEINNLTLSGNKITLIFIISSATLFYFLPNISYILFRYFNLFSPEIGQTNLLLISTPTIDSQISNAALKIMELNKLRLFFGTIIGSILITILISNISLIVTKNNDVKNVITLNFLMFIVPFGFMSFALIGILKSWVVLIYIFLIVVVTDASCYIFGLFFGKHKMAPVISPNKTWEGAIYGFVCSVVIIMIYCILWKFDDYNIGFRMLSIFNNLENVYEWIYWIWIIPTTITLVFMTIIGDLAFSYIKRKFEIKDFSNILKSHGGILDRVDSMIFVASTYTIILFIMSSMVDFPLFQ